jgi:hypothetical protein
MKEFVPSAASTAITSRKKFEICKVSLASEVLLKNSHQMLMYSLRA